MPLNKDITPEPSHPSEDGEEWFPSHRDRSPSHFVIRSEYAHLARVLTQRKEVANAELYLSPLLNVKAVVRHRCATHLSKTLAQMSIWSERREDGLGMELQK
jgi:hypothetical protein